MKDYKRNLSEQNLLPKLWDMARLAGLGNLEVFSGEYVDCPGCDFRNFRQGIADQPCEFCRKLLPAKKDGTGFYYWFCLPGCLPDSEPSGPYATVRDAILDAIVLHGDDGISDEDEDEENPDYEKLFGH